LDPRVSFAIGIFDLFTYAIPGSLYLAFLGYLAARLHWVDPAAAGRAPVVLLTIGVAVVSYLLGYVAYSVGERVERILPTWRRRRPREEFHRRVPAAAGREFVEADRFLLLSALQLHDKDVALEVTRVRANGLMLRNAAPPLLFGFAAAVVELVLGANPLLAIFAAVLCLGGFGSLIAQGRRLRHWAGLKTLELCFWLPEVDALLRQVSGEPPPAMD
jgi:hypothetical protein